MWDASLFLYQEIATMKKIYMCSLAFSSNCYYTGKQKVICPYCKLVSLGFARRLSLFEAYFVEGQLGASSAIPLEPLPIEGTFLILRVSGKPIIYESKLESCLLYSVTESEL